MPHRTTRTIPAELDHLVLATPDLSATVAGLAEAWPLSRRTPAGETPSH